MCTVAVIFENVVAELASFSIKILFLRKFSLGLHSHPDIRLKLCVLEKI